MMLRSVLAGAAGAIVVCALIAYVAVNAGLVPANADATPGGLERWAARTSLHATLRRDAPRTENPVAVSDANLNAGIKLYAANCIVCHGAADKRPSNIALGLYQRAPQLSSDGVEDDPQGVSFWKIKHGIRLTAMPAYTATLTDRQIWTLALFLNRMDKLPPGPQREWLEARNPVATQSPPPERGGE